MVQIVQFPTTLELALRGRIRQHTIHVTFAQSGKQTLPNKAR